MPRSVLRSILETLGSGLEAVTAKWHAILIVAVIALALLFLLILFAVAPLFGLAVVIIAAIVYLQRDSGDLI